MRVKRSCGDVSQGKYHLSIFAAGQRRVGAGFALPADWRGLAGRARLPEGAGAWLTCSGYVAAFPRALRLAANTTTRLCCAPTADRQGPSEWGWLGILSVQQSTPSPPTPANHNNKNSARKPRTSPTPSFCKPSRKGKNLANLPQRQRSEEAMGMCMVSKEYDWPPLYLPHLIKDLGMSRQQTKMLQIRRKEDTHRVPSPRSWYSLASLNPNPHSHQKNASSTKVAALRRQLFLSGDLSPAAIPRKEPILS